MFFLSYVLDKSTPTYGNRSQFLCTKKSSITVGDVANDSLLQTTVHIGTHIDMPYHFYEEGQTIEDFDADFWRFKKPLYIELKPKSLIIKEELIAFLETLEDLDYDILIVKTGICHNRDSKVFWEKNYGFHPDVYDYLIKKFTNIRVFGFDSISVSSFSNRLLGREAHKRFLNPKKPILLLEDMDLRGMRKAYQLKELWVSPMRIAKCDGLPCTVFGVLND